MMKNPTTYLLLALALVAVGCNSKTTKTTTTTSTPYNPYTTGGTTTSGTTGSTTSGTTTGTTTSGTWPNPITGYPQMGYTVGVELPASCVASTTTSGETCSDFSSTYSSLPSYPIAMAGGQVWGPGLSRTATSTIGALPTVDEMVAITKTDAKLRVRFRVLGQPATTAGREICNGRALGQQGDACVYHKLRFRTGAVPKSVYQSYLSSGSSASSRNFGLLANYISTYVSSSGGEGVGKDKCSVWYDLPHVPGQDYVIVVADVNSDNKCREKVTDTNGSYAAAHCPNTDPVRAASCWAMDMQIQTDYTNY